MRKSFDVLLLPGDGIGPEVVGAAREVIDAAAEHFRIEVRYEERRIGGTAIREEGEPVSAETLDAAGASDSVLLGAVGHPDFDDAPVRPEAGLLKLRKSLGAFANLRPVAAIPALIGSSPLKREVVDGVDVLIVRELTGGAYFGEKEEGEERASDLSVYTQGGDRAGRPGGFRCREAPQAAGDERGQGERHGDEPAVAQGRL